MSAAHDTVGSLVLFQQLKYFLPVPAWVPEFYSRTHPPGKLVKKISQPVIIKGKEWRKLYQ
jgi:hypothetical protein